MSGVDEIDNANIRLIRMLTMQATCILMKGALSGHRHRQHQGIQRRMIEPLNSPVSQRQDHPRCTGRQRSQLTD